MKSCYSSSSHKREHTVSFESVMSFATLLFALLFSSTSNAQLAVSCSGTQATCNGAANGAATVIVASGSAPYTYHWSNGGTTASITNLLPGTYSVIVIDNLSDSAVCSYTVVQPTALHLNDSIGNPTCHGCSNGFILAFTNGGSSPYTYQWSNGATTAFISGLVAGTYTVTVVDAHGCTASASITLTQPRIVISGIVGGPWTAIATWGANVPSPTDCVVVSTSGANKITLTGDFTVANLTLTPGSNLEIEPGSSLTLTQSVELQALSGSYGNITGGGTLKLAGTAAQTINVDQGASLNNLLIDNATGASLSSTNPLLINSSLTFLHGNLSTGSGIVMMPFDATVSASQSTGWINGAIQRNFPTTPPDPCITSFEVGDNSSYAPMQTTLHGLTGSGGSFKGSTTGGNNSFISASGIDATRSVTRTYSLINSGAVFTNYDLTVNFQTDQYPSGADPNKFYISQTENGGGSWIMDRNETYTRTTTSVKVDRLAGNSDFVAGVPVCDLTINAGIDEDTYYGYSGDQSVSHTVTSLTGFPPYTFTWTLNRPLNCNVITSSGDETFSVAGGSCNGTTICPTTGNTGPTPQCTYTGDSSTVNALLLDTGIVCLTVTDNIGCTASSCFTIRATDARCFSGNSGNQKVIVCHQTGNSHNPWVQLCVDQDAVASLIANGDYPGRCTANHKEESSGISSNTDIEVFPNPAHEAFTIRWNCSTEGSYIMQLTDMTGRVVISNKHTVHPGLNYEEIDLGNITVGVYFLTVNDEIRSKQMMVVVE